MTSPVPRDRELLSNASIALEQAVARAGLEASSATRLRILEGAAAHIGGYHLDDYDAAVGSGRMSHLPCARDVEVLSSGLADALQDGPLPPSLALAALGDSDLDRVARRRQGRYFTDSRLALRLAAGARDRARRAASILDPACGAGMLLVAAVLNAGRTDAQRTKMVSDVLWGIDRDPLAVRAATAAIASLTENVGAIANLRKRLFATDSLAAGSTWWAARAPAGFDLVIANPPWEKLRVTRHEHALRNGHRRHYGADYRPSEVDDEALRSDRRATSGYRDQVSSELVHQGGGEADLYKMFLELGAALTSESGALAFLVPAGFIRNRGTRELREWLFHNFDADILILNNRKRYFEIDSRFKFVQLIATRGRSHKWTIRFGVGESLADRTANRVQTNLVTLRRIQPDLAIPEIDHRQDWDLLARLSRLHPRLGDPEGGWIPRFHREVDMTSDRPHFRERRTSPSALPVIEGRMVHQHRVSAKRYIAGRGRRAKWRVQPASAAVLCPQWFIERRDLRPSVAARTAEGRAGFCDITGQTNERTVLAALIPPGVVCGNKVPTLEFQSSVQARAWVGIANSFVFDWLARRSVTTTLNFFILRNLPIPAWREGARHFEAIAEASGSLANAECLGGLPDMWGIGDLRAKIDWLTAQLYGLTVSEFDQILRDFPQVDRAQPPVEGEPTSTVTRDLIVSLGTNWASPSQSKRAAERVRLAESVGAVPFVPNEHARKYGAVD